MLAVTKNTRVTDGVTIYVTGRRKHHETSHCRDIGRLCPIPRVQDDAATQAGRPRVRPSSPQPHPGLAQHVSQHRGDLRLELPPFVGDKVCC